MSVDSLSSIELRKLLDDFSQRLSSLNESNDRNYIEAVNTILEINKALRGSLIRESLQKERQYR